MELSAFEQGTLLLAGLGVKDENLIDEAIRVVEKKGNYKNALKESSQYEFLSGTKILFKLLDEEPEEDETHAFARHCSTKFHAINSYFSNKSVQEGSGFNELIDKEKDFIQAFSLTPREAWTLYFVGGREFIKNIRFARDGSEIINKLRVAIAKADRHIESEKTLKLDGGQGAGQSLLGSMKRF